MASLNPHDVPLTEAAAGTPRREYWRALIEEWHRSGVSQAEFCRRGGIARRSFSFWKAKMSWKAGVGAASSASVPARPSERPAFVPVRITSPRPPSVAPKTESPTDGGGEIEIALEGGRLVRVRGRVDAQWLGQVLEAVVAARC